MNYQKKFKQGPEIQYMSSLVICLDRDYWIMLRGVPKSPKFMRNMSYSTLEGFVRHGMVHLAERV